jgi:hypothetical protein
MLVSCFAYSSALEMEPKHSFKILTDFTGLYGIISQNTELFTVPLWDPTLSELLLFDTTSVKNSKEYRGDEWESYTMDGESYKSGPSANAL